MFPLVQYAKSMLFLPTPQNFVLACIINSQILHAKQHFPRKDEYFVYISEVD